MLKKAKKKLKGGITFQFQFTVTVKSVEFTVADKKWQPGKLHVEWKRNARIASTQGIHVDLNQGGPNVVNFHNEEISMLGSLSKDGDIYDPKEYRVSLEDIRDKKSKKSLASLQIDFSQYASLTGASFERTLDLEILSTKISSAKVHLTISSRFLSQGVKDDDDMSMMSTASMQPESTRAADSSDSDNESHHGDKKKDISAVKDDKKDQQIQELLEKIKYLEFDLSNAYASKQSEKDEAEKEVLLMKTKVAIENERHQIAIENLVKSKEDAEQELKNLKEKIEKDAAHHAEQVDALRKELVLAKTSQLLIEPSDHGLAEKMKQAHDESEAKMSALKSSHDKELSALKADLASSEKAHAAKAKEFEQSQATLASLQTSLGEKEPALDKANKELSQAVQQVAALKQASEQASTEHSKAIAEQNKTLAANTKTITELRESLALAESQAAKQKAQDQALLQERGEGAEKEKSAQLIIKEKDAKVAELEKKLQVLTEQSASLANDLHETQVLRSTNDQLQRKCKKLEEDLSSKAEELEKLSKQQSAEGSQQTAALEEQIAELEQELKTAATDFGSKIEELQHLITSLREENEEEILTFERDTTKLKNENAGLKEEVEELQKELDEATSKTRNLQDNSVDSSKVEELRTLLKNAQNDYSEFRKKYDRLSNMYEAQEKVIEEMKHAVPKAAEPPRSDDLDNLRNQNLKMSEELHDITSQLIEAKMALAEGEFQYESMKQAKKEAIKQLATEKLKIVELRKKLTQFELKHATK